ncbi:MAG: CHASE2 domain-containing protein [Cyanobacteria bacterium P01_D01_bin.1]
MIPGLVASGLVALLLVLQAWAPLERMVDNQVIRWHGAHGWDPRLVMISIDDKTIDQIGQFPISRDYYAELLKLLSRDRASVVAFNLILSDNVASDSPPAGSIPPTANENGTGRALGRSATARMAKAMQQHGCVVLGQVWNSGGEVIEPVPILTKAAFAIGHLRLPFDRDGFTRTVEVTYRGVPALGVAAAQAYGVNHALKSAPDNNLSNFQINWPGPVSELTTLSMVDVLSGAVPSSFFTDRIVFVSYGATSSHTPMRTPFNYRWPVPGGYMHPAVVDNLLNQNWLRPVSDQVVLLILLLGGPLLSGMLFRWEWPVQLTVALLLLSVWLLVGVTALQMGYLLPIVSPGAVILGTSLFVVVWRQLQSNALLQVRSAFLNTMSHEIRTPLNAIVNLSEMLQETPLSDRQREYAETLYGSSQTLMALVNDVLDFSKIEAGQLTIEDYPVNICDIIERSIDLVASRAAAKNIEIVYAIAPNVPGVIMSDPVRLQQILSNLLSNAVKFTAVGEVTVRVEAHPCHRPNPQTRWQRLLQQIKQCLNRPSANRHQADRQSKTSRSSQSGLYDLCFEVIDTGIGIPAERIPHLFKPFSQASASTTRKYGGTGLGLSISKRLSERMGGDIWVKSTLGRGSQFYFNLKTQVAQTTLPPPKYLTGLRGTRLLVIDSNQTRREQIGRHLQAVDIQALQAKSLIEAQELVSNALIFDGLILDEAVVSTMSESGPQFEGLRSILGDRQIPIIVLSALNSDLSRTPDSVVILWKPIKQSALYQVLRSICPPTLNAAPRTLISRPDVLVNKANIKILIAEDNRVNQQVALRLLEFLGYSADVVETGVEVLAAIKHRHYDVVLMDMRMPDMDGVEATRQIRQLPQHRDIWIIAMTANVTPSDHRLCLAAGMDDYLRKPIKREALSRALDRNPRLQRIALD